jgi:hypothetical protein
MPVLATNRRGYILQWRQRAKSDFEHDLIDTIESLLGKIPQIVTVIEEWRGDGFTKYIRHEDGSKTVIKDWMECKFPYVYFKETAYSSAVIQHTLSGGRVVRMCQRCLLKVTEKDSPDPYWYSGKWIADYLARPAKDRCGHRRVG